MPSYWYSFRDIKNVPSERQELCTKICAQYKPYFMCYVYPELKKQYSDFLTGSRRNLRRRFYHQGFDDIRELPDETELDGEIHDFAEHYRTDRKIGNNDCTVNKICHLFEEEFAGSGRLPEEKPFDYSILKSGVEYSQKDYLTIEKIFQDYSHELQQRIKFQKKSGNRDAEEVAKAQEAFERKFLLKAYTICPNELELCDIVLDICYRREGSKQFCWEIAGDQIIENLLKNSGGTLSYPVRGGNEFTYGGEGFRMETIEVGKELS